MTEIVSDPIYDGTSVALCFVSESNANKETDMKKIVVATAVAVLMSQAAFGAPILQTSDFIAVGDRTNSVDFEPIGSTTSFGNTFTQDGVTVTQVNGELNGIWTTCGSSCWFSNNSLSWYPNGGDFGWTEITKADGSDFTNIGLDVGGSIFGWTTLLYELLQNGSSVLFGSLTLPSTSDGYIGFSDGGFDLVRLRSTQSGAGTFGDSAYNALSIDNVELSGNTNQVPEPGNLALLGLGLAGLIFSRRKTKPNE